MREKLFKPEGANDKAFLKAIISLLKDLAPIRKQLQLPKKIPYLDLSHKLNELYMITSNMQKRLDNNRKATRSAKRLCYV